MHDPASHQLPSSQVLSSPLSAASQMLLPLAPGGDLVPMSGLDAGRVEGESLLSPDKYTLPEGRHII